MSPRTLISLQKSHVDRFLHYYPLSLALSPVTYRCWVYKYPPPPLSLSFNPFTGSQGGCCIGVKAGYTPLGESPAHCRTLCEHLGFGPLLKGTLAVSWRCPWIPWVLNTEHYILVLCEFWGLSTTLPPPPFTVGLLTQAILFWAQSKFNISVGGKGGLWAYKAACSEVREWMQLCLTQVHTWLHSILLCYDPVGPFGTLNGEICDVNAARSHAGRGTFGHLWEMWLHLAKGNISYLWIFHLCVTLVKSCNLSPALQWTCLTIHAFYVPFCRLIVQQSHIVMSLPGKGDILGPCFLLFGCCLHPLFCRIADNTKSLCQHLK